MMKFLILIFGLVVQHSRSEKLCLGQLTMQGTGAPGYVLGGPGSVAGDTLNLPHSSGFSIMSKCDPSWVPQDFFQFKVLEKTLSYTVDLSKVGCGCNLAVYMIQEPAKNPAGQPSEGTCQDSSPYYCDANKVCGQWCPEMDIMEANIKAFQSTPHACDAPTGTGHYNNCDRSGCGKTTKDIPNSYGPGPTYQIDTTRPFDVQTVWQANNMLTKLVQGPHTVVLDHSSCGGALAGMHAAMSSGMSLRITYWGDSPGTMAWLDQPPCGPEACSGANAGPARISNIRVTPPMGPPVAPPLPVPPVPVPPQPPKEPYDCTVGAADWEAEWPAAKKMWCCGHKGVGCISTPVGTQAPVPAPSGPTFLHSFLQQYGSLIFCIVLLGLASVAVAILGPRIWKSRESAFEMMHGRRGRGRSLHLQRGDHVAVRNSFVGAGRYWGQAPLTRGTPGVVEDVDTMGRATIAFSDHQGKFSVPQSDFENLEIHRTATAQKTRTGMAVALALACTLIAFILSWQHHNGQAQPVVAAPTAAPVPLPPPAPPALPVAMPAATGAGCCSWDGGAHCGDTTPWCKASKANCEGQCRGKWKLL